MTEVKYFPVSRTANRKDMTKRLRALADVLDTDVQVDYVFLATTFDDKRHLDFGSYTRMLFTEKFDRVFQNTCLFEMGCDVLAEMRDEAVGAPLKEQTMPNTQEEWEKIILYLVCGVGG